MLLLHFLNLLLRAVLVRLKIKGRISGFVNWRENCYIHAQTANRSSMRLSQMTFNNARLNTYVRSNKNSPQADASVIRNNFLHDPFSLYKQQQCTFLLFTKKKFCIFRSYLAMNGSQLGSRGYIGAPTAAYCKRGGGHYNA